MGNGKKEKHSLRFWLVGFALMLTPIGLLLGWRFSCQSEFDRRVAQLKAQGFPVSLDDLEAQYVLPEGAENAADVYIQAFACQMAPTAEEEKWLPYSRSYEWPDDVPPFPAEVMNAMASRLERNQQSLELLDQAATIEHCLWPRTLNSIFFMNDHLSTIKNAAQLLCERNLYLAQKGQTDELFDSFQTANALSKTLLKQPFLIDHLVMIALNAILADNLENVLIQLNDQNKSFTEAQWRALQEQFSDMQDMNGFHRSMVVERCCTIEFLLLAPDEQSKCMLSSPSLGRQILYSASGFKQKDTLIILDMLEKQILATQLPYHQRTEAFQKIEEEFGGGLLAFLRLYLNEYSPGKKKVFEIDLRVTGNLLCAETALAVERYRQTYGMLPETPAALVPEFMAELPRDPFDNAPLRYIKRDRSFTLYHIGPDGIDDGGLDRDDMAEKTGEQRPEQYDWPFTVGW